MAKTIEINEGELRSVINEAVRKVLNEDTYSQNDSFALSPNFENGLEELESMYDRLKGFINEYPIVIKSLLKNAQQFGLQLKSSPSESNFNLEEAMSGQVYYFDLHFVFNGVDVDSMSDEEYEKFEDRLNYTYNELEYVIGKPSFGTIRMYATEDGIQIEYAFRLK